MPADLGSYYGAPYYGNRHGATAKYCTRRRVRLLTKCCGSGAGRCLLDVGCGDGAFLLKARAHEWRVIGTEMSPQRARQAGLDVCNSLGEAAVGGPFDCVTAWHVLEHFQDPLATLEQIRTLLAPGGTLLLAVPDALGHQARLTGRKWLHLDVPRHLHHFGKRSLKLHLTRAGFDVVRTWHGEFEYDVLGWSQSALNWLFPAAPNSFFAILTGRATSIGRAERAANIALGCLLSGAALLPTWCEMLFGGAGTLIMAAKPREHIVPS